MPTVKIEKHTSLTADESFKRISGLLQNDRDLKKMDPQLACTFDSASLSGQASGKQFKAKMKVTPSNPGSTVEVTVDLPFHLALVKGVVEKTLSRKLDETLA